MRLMRALLVRAASDLVAQFGAAGSLVGEYAPLLIRRKPPARHQPSAHISFAGSRLRRDVSENRRVQLRGSGARTSSCVRAALPAPSLRSVERLRPKRAASAASCRACFGCCTGKTSGGCTRAHHYAAGTETRVASDGPIEPFVQPHDLRVIDLRNRVRA